MKKIESTVLDKLYGLVSVELAAQEDYIQEKQIEILDRTENYCDNAYIHLPIIFLTLCMVGNFEKYNKTQILRGSEI